MDEREETATTVPWEDEEESGEEAESSVAETLLGLNAARAGGPRRVRVAWREGASVVMSGVPTKEAFFHPRRRTRGLLSRLSVSLAAARLVTGCENIDALVASGIDRVSFAMHFGWRTYPGTLMMRVTKATARAELVFRRYASLCEQMREVGNVTAMNIVFKAARNPHSFHLAFVPKSVQ